MRVLVVEDEPRLADLLARGLREAGHAAHVRHTGSDGLLAATGEQYDTVVLDVMLPGLDGLAVCRTLRDRGIRVPVQDAHRPQRCPRPGLRARRRRRRLPEQTLPSTNCSPGRAPSHRRATDETGTELIAGDLRLDAGARRVFRDRTEIELSAREFAILALLMARAGQCVTRYQILDEVWDGEPTMTLQRHQRLHRQPARQARQPSDRHTITTLRGAGYRLSEPGGGR